MKLGCTANKICVRLHLAAILVKVMAVAAVGTGHKKQNVDTTGKLFQLAGTVGNAVAHGVIGYKIRGTVSFNVGY